MAGRQAVGERIPQVWTGTENHAKRALNPSRPFFDDLCKPFTRRLLLDALTRIGWMDNFDNEPPFLRAIDQREFEANQFDDMASIALVTNEFGETLLHLRDDKPDISHPNQWGFLGGRSEEGEDPTQTLLRELFEEAEIQIESAEPLCRIVDFDGSRDLVTVFRVVTEIKLEDMRLHEGQEIRFFSQEEIRELALDPLVREILNQFFKSN